jgi:flagellar basal-body rod modification protein FlgD
MTKIDPSLYLQKQSMTRSTSSQLGKDEFLKILMAQLQNQDPMNPMEDKEFISQMANFSSLEQLMSISGSIDGLVQLQSFTPVVEYSHLIGKNISYNVYDENGLLEKVDQGVVEGVSASVNGVELVLKSGDRVPVGAIVEISNGENS